MNQELFNKNDIVRKMLSYSQKKIKFYPTDDSHLRFYCDKVITIKLPTTWAIVKQNIDNAANQETNVACYMCLKKEPVWVSEKAKARKKKCTAQFCCDACTKPYCSDCWIRTLKENKGIFTCPHCHDICGFELDEENLGNLINHCNDLIKQTKQGY